MLIEFSVSNFRSISDQVTFSMLASNDKDMEDNLMTCEALNDDHLLRTATIYGANASGKTNLILAFNYLRDLVVNSHNYQKGTMINHMPFKLDDDLTSLPSKFEIVFIKNNIKYIYGLSVSNFIHDEYLYHYPKGKKALIFKRTDTNNYEFPRNERTNASFFEEKTPENVLYLSRATQLNYDRTEEAFNWFIEDFKVLLVSEAPNMTRYTAKLLNEAKSKQRIMKAMQVADLGIDDMNADFKLTTLDDLPLNLPDEIKKFLPSKANNKFEQMNLYTMHGDKIFDFDTEESAGTQKFFSLLGPLIDTLTKGYILVVDELDTKLHLNLIMYLIKLFHDGNQNIGKSQLIFTTHNVSLLDQDLFRRDQIWITEKDHDKGNSDLYSILEFKPRKDKNLRKGYLAGRYGGIPYIKNEGIISNDRV